MKLRLNSSQMMPIEDICPLFLKDSRNVIRNAGHYPLVWFELDEVIFHPSIKDAYRKAIEICLSLLS